MPKLDKHISELLYDHECVIVPELGGFLSSYAPSRIHSTRHTVTPPSKKIAFNVFLRHNDGLLANYIVQTESITYPEALLEIEGYVDLCNRQLSAGKKFIIEQVGILTRDSETNLQFEPFNSVNYLKDAFGLSPVQFIPILNKEFEHEVEKQLRDFIALRPSQPLPRTTLGRKKVRLNSINTLLLAGSLLWLCLNLYLVSPDHLNIASLNPFSVTVQESATPQPSAIENPAIYTQPPAGSGEPAATGELESGDSAFEKALGKKLMRQNYYIVAGAFKSRENAARKESELEADGFLNAQILEDQDGLLLVCYDGFSTRQDAIDELARMKSRQQEGWIFSR